MHSLLEDNVSSVCNLSPYFFPLLWGQLLMAYSIYVNLYRSNSLKVCKKVKTSPFGIN